MQFSQIDQSTISLTVDTSGSKAALFVLPQVGRGVAHCHLSRGANQSGNGQTFSDAIKVTGVVDIVLGPNDSQDWSFNFLQFANLMVRSTLWGGRTASEGSVFINYAIGPAFPTNPSLDSTAQFDPFVNLLSSPQSEVAEGSNRRITLTRVMGDHPNSKVPLKLPNIAANVDNFLFNNRLDLGLTTVFVAREPNNGTVHSLAHFTWHLIYDAKFSWNGSVCTGTMANGRLDVGPVTKGVPSDPTIQTLLKTPKSPFYNKLAEQANNFVNKNSSPPNYVESATRDSSIPGNFYT
jgi:hypothetical protein